MYIIYCIFDATEQNTNCDLAYEIIFETLREL